MAPSWKLKLDSRGLSLSDAYDALGLPVRFKVAYGTVFPIYEGKLLGVRRGTENTDSIIEVEYGGLGFLGAFSCWRITNFEVAPFAAAS